MDMRRLADEIVGGRRLERGEDLSFFVSCPLEQLREGADSLRRHFVGEQVDLCTILSGRSGRCGEDCKFCAQSVHHHTDCRVYPLLDEETIVGQAKANEAEGVSRFSVVDSGHGPSAEELEQLLQVFRRLHRECGIELCCSLGFMSREQFRRLREAGVVCVHNNIETSRRYFPQICTTHSFDDKLDNIRRAQMEGLHVCSGGIIGMGEGWEDRMDMALTLSGLGIRSVPLNTLVPIPGTPLEHMPRLSEEEILRTVALFRYILPEADIRLAGGRVLMRDNGRPAFTGGANASITGNMLTTCGATIAEDMAMLRALGRDVTPDWKRPETERRYQTARAAGGSSIV